MLGGDAVLCQITLTICFCCILYGVLDDMSNIFANIVRLKSDLVNIVEPDFGLLNELLRLGVLTHPQLADICTERAVYMRNDALLDLLLSEDQCDKFVTALQQTDQQHVVNFITENGGQAYMT